MNKYIIAGVLVGAVLAIASAASAGSPQPSCVVTASPAEVPPSVYDAGPVDVTFTFTSQNAKGLNISIPGEWVGGGGTNASGYVVVRVTRPERATIAALSNETFKTSGSYGLCSVSI